MSHKSKWFERISNVYIIILILSVACVTSTITLLVHQQGKFYWKTNIAIIFVMTIFVSFIGMVVGVYILFPLVGRFSNGLLHRSLLRRADAIRKRFESGEFTADQVIDKIKLSTPRERNILIDCLMASGMEELSLNPAIKRAYLDELLKRVEDQSPRNIVITMTLVGTLAITLLLAFAYPRLQDEFVNDPSKLETQLKILLIPAGVLFFWIFGSDLVKRKRD